MLSVLKWHVENNPDLTFSQLEQAFPRMLQGSYGCFVSVAQAQNIYGGGRKRHYLKPEELIGLKDETIAVCTEWGKGNIGAFITRAGEHGHVIEEEQQ